VTTAAKTTIKLFRAFKTGTDGRPLCGDAGTKLGIRPGKDITADADGLVQPLSGGMSVTPEDMTFLPPFARPTSLGGHGELPVFAIESSALGEKLSYRPDPKKPTNHGFIEPALAMLLAAYSTALAQTGRAWKKVYP
jgi:hypothetical protein